MDFVAISVDPERDTVERVHEYTESWGMLDKWSFLVGAEETLRPIWKGYYLDPAQIDWERDGPPATSKRFAAPILRSWWVKSARPGSVRML